MAICWEDHIELKILKKRLSEKFDLLDYLGKGGFGKVFKLRDRSLNRKCALKILNIFELAENSDEKREESKQRFLKEARALAKCKHQNIVSIYDISGEDTFPYLIMEYIEGMNLGSLLKKEEILEFDEIIKISEVILPALEYIHTNGLIHRDLKPDNIIVEKGTGRIVIIDFSIARDIVGGTKISDISFIPGTPFYMAPEQFKNIVVPDIDIYSYGVILYQMLTGEVPFKGKLLEIIQGHLTEAVPEVRKKNPQAPRGIQAIIEKAMAKESEYRYAKAADLLNDLKKLGIQEQPANGENEVEKGKEDTLFIALRKIFEDKYRLEYKRIGGGLFSQSLFYQAHHKVLEEDHVLKIWKLDMKSIKSESDKRKERFKQEAHFFNKFKHHQHIVDIIDAGFFPYKQEQREYEIPYLIFKYIRGLNLKQLIAKEGPLELGKVFDIAAGILSAMIDVHKNNYFYWSMKPEDILIDKQNKQAAVLINAGFMQGIDVYNETEYLVSNISIDKHLVENLVSPAAASFSAGFDYGAAADISLFGVLLYEMVTGESRYDSGFLAALVKRRDNHFSTLALLNPNLPAGITGILEKTLPLAPERRYTSAKRILQELKEVKKTCRIGLTRKNEQEVTTERVYFLDQG